MLVNVTINKLKSDEIRICVTKPSPWDANCFKDFNPLNARKILVEFGFSEALVNEQLRQLQDYEPTERIDLNEKDIPQNILEALGFRLPSE